MEFYIGQIFEEMYPDTAADWCNSNNAEIVEIDPVVRTVTEEYEVIDEETGEIHIETREVEKELRCFRIDAIPEPTVEEKNEAVKQTRASLYAELIDPLHAQKNKDTIMGEWSEEKEQEYIAEVKRLTIKIREENPYVELTVDSTELFS